MYAGKISGKCINADFVDDICKRMFNIISFDDADYKTEIGTATVNHFYFGDEYDVEYSLDEFQKILMSFNIIEQGE